MEWIETRIIIGSDHAGFERKTELIALSTAWGLEVTDLGTHSAESVDYPDFAHPVAETVEKNGVLGVLICGSGNGVCMAANKHAGIRAALCWTVELAELARQHNDANILCIPARFVDLETSSAMLKAFLTTRFEGGRHSNRVNKISC